MSEKRANAEVMRFTNTGEVYLYGLGVKDENICIFYSIHNHNNRIFMPFVCTGKLRITIRTRKSLQKVGGER